jgi:1,4-alpha-glucan branching enzyme
MARGFGPEEGWSMALTRFAAEFPGASSVYLAGDFNDWTPESRRMKRMRKGDDTFVAVVDLNPGQYEYKFLVDGQWACCAEAPRVGNDLGSENNVIEVGASAT